MFESIANVVVIVLFGALIGAMVSFSNAYNEASLRAAQSRMPQSLGLRRPGKGFFRSLRKWHEDSQEGVREAAAKLPMVGQIAVGLMCALIAMLVLSIIFGPLKMNWFAFLPSVFAGGIVSHWLFNQAKTGKVSATGRGLCNLLPEHSSGDNPAESGRS